MIRRCERCGENEWWYRGVCATCYSGLKAAGEWERWVEERERILDSESPEFERALAEWRP